MGNLLKNNVAPLWVWLVVIAVGSLVLTGLVITLMLCRIRKRRANSKQDLESSGLTRRVTLKRGRLVEQTSRLSLTGPNFGLTSDRGTEPLTSPATVRSASPFEWWASIKERSVSRQSQRSQDTVSVHNDRTASTAKSTDLAMDLSPHRTSLSSLNEKITARNSTSLSDSSSISKPLIAMTAETSDMHAVNFSRPQPCRATSASKGPRLSIIKETTPRNSFLSITSFRSRIVSWTSATNEHDRPESHNTGDRSDTSNEKALDQIHVQTSEKVLELASSSEPPSIVPRPIQVRSTPEPALISDPRPRSGSPSDPSLQPSAELMDVSSELPSRHLSQKSIVANNPELENGTLPSRSNSTTNFSRKPAMTTRTRSGRIPDPDPPPNPPTTDQSGSSSPNRYSSTTNFSRLANIQDNSRTSSNTSWFEAPIVQAASNGLFENPIVNRNSQASVRSSNPKESNLQQRITQPLANSTTNSKPSEDIECSPHIVASDAHPTKPQQPLQENNTEIGLELPMADPSPYHHKQENERVKEAKNRQSISQPTNPSSRRSRGPIRARSANKGNRNVLRKRSLRTNGERSR